MGGGVAMVASTAEGRSITKPGHSLQRVWHKICPLSWGSLPPPPIFCCDRSAVSVPLAGTDRPDGRTCAEAQRLLEHNRSEFH